MKNILYIFMLIPVFATSAENLEERITSLENRVAELEQLLSVADSPQEAIADLSSFKPGTYFLDTNIATHLADDESGFVIYHTMTTVRSEESEFSIQFGAGRKGLLTWQFYVDYNNDGIADMDMIESFLDSLPLMGILSRSVDAEASQNVYRIMIENVQLSEHTPPEEIAENASAISRQIWEYVQSQSAAMADWIKQRYTQSENNV